MFSEIQPTPWYINKTPYFRVSSTQQDLQNNVVDLFETPQCPMIDGPANVM